MKQDTTYHPTEPTIEANGVKADRPAADRPRRARTAPANRRSTNDGAALLETLVRNGGWLFGAAVVLALLAGAAAWMHWKTTYTAIAQVVRYQSPNDEEVFRPRNTPPQTFALMLRSPELVRLVSEQTTNPRLTPEQVAAKSRVTPEYNSDLITVAVADVDPQKAVELANLYAREGVRFTQGIQADAAEEVSTYLRSQLTEAETRLKDLQNQMLLVQRFTASRPISGNTSAVSAQMALAAGASPSMARLEAARDELLVLLEKYMEAHPSVIAARAKVAALEREVNATGGAPARVPAPGTNSAQGLAAAGVPDLPPLATLPTDPETLRSQIQLTENIRSGLNSRLTAAQLFQKSPPGYLKLFGEASPGSVTAEGPLLKIGGVALFGGLLGFFGAAGLILASEFAGSRLRTAADVERVTGLPVLARLGDTSRMTPAQESLWGFRTWTALQNRLSRSPNQGMVCAVTSALEGEGRSHLIGLLAKAANQLGFRVLTVGTRPAAPGEEPTGPVVASPPPKSANGTAPAAATSTTSERPNLKDALNSRVVARTAAPDAKTITSNVLAYPAQVSAQLATAEFQPLVHIPLPGWVWNLERRKLWQSALSTWSNLDNVVILVELPPASTPEAVLLAENVPNLIWLVDSGKPDANETRRQLETLRDARCELVGAVLNHEPSAPLRKIFPRWQQPAGGMSPVGA